NQAPAGGAICNNDTGLINVTNSTISNNAATGGGGISNNGSTSPKVRNSIVALNSATNQGPDLQGAFTSLCHNPIGKNDASPGFPTGSPNASGAIAGTASAPVNPRLAALANNGGPTQTLALLAGSPALDAGDDCVTQASHCGDPNIPQITTDQRGTGFARMVD